MGRVSVNRSKCSRPLNSNNIIIIIMATTTTAATRTMTTTTAMIIIIIILALNRRTNYSVADCVFGIVWDGICDLPNQRHNHYHQSASSGGDSRLPYMNIALCDFISLSFFLFSFCFSNLFYFSGATCTFIVIVIFVILNACTRAIP